MQMTRRLLAILLFTVLGLSACGGGGGGGDNPPPANRAPTANAGSDQSVDEGATVNLIGTGTDSDGSIASYSWQQTSGTNVTISNSNTASASFVAPMVDTNEDLVFRLTVTDNDGANGSDTITVSVNDLAPVTSLTWDEGNWDEVNWQ